jgi:hypothetical protein
LTAIKKKSWKIKKRFEDVNRTLQLRLETF